MRTFAAWKDGVWTPPRRDGRDCENSYPKGIQNPEVHVSASATLTSLQVAEFAILVGHSARQCYTTLVLMQVEASTEASQTQVRRRV